MLSPTVPYSRNFVPLKASLAIMGIAFVGTFVVSLPAFVLYEMAQVPDVAEVASTVDK